MAARLSEGHNDFPKMQHLSSLEIHNIVWTIENNQLLMKALGFLIEYS